MAFWNLGWHPVRLLGVISAFFASITVLILWHDSPLTTHTRLALQTSNNESERWHNATLLHKNAYQLDPPPKEPPYGAVVAAARTATDLSWMIFFQLNWTTFPYNIDNPHNPDERLRIPQSKGHEAMVYLSFIIENYESLPWCTVFVHGHSDAWHQDDTIVGTINDLNRAMLARTGYISLRCDWFPSCPAEIRPKHHDALVWGPGLFREETEAAIAGNWRRLFPGERMPETIASQCCAQFAVTRQAIWRRPKGGYERMRTWLVETSLEDDVSGRVFEKLWAYIFTGEGVYCPPPQQCACEYFGRCDEKEWSAPPEGLSPPPAWP